MNKAVLVLLMLGGGCGAAAPQAEEKPAATAPKAGERVAATAPVAAEAARGVEDPRTFIAEEYAAIARDPSAERDPAFAYSDRLRALFDLALWIFWALLNLLTFCAACKRSVERTTLRYCQRQRLKRLQAAAAAA